MSKQEHFQVTSKLMPYARKCSGSEFQTVGPAKAKTREPNVLRRTRGTVSVDGQRQIANEGDRQRRRPGRNNQRDASVLDCGNNGRSKLVLTPSSV